MASVLVDCRRPRTARRVGEDVMRRLQPTDALAAGNPGGVAATTPSTANADPTEAPAASPGAERDEAGANRRPRSLAVPALLGAGALVVAVALLVTGANGSTRDDRDPEREQSSVPAELTRSFTRATGRSDFDRAQPLRRVELPRAHDRQPRRARWTRGRHRQLHDARHVDGNVDLPPPRAPRRRYVYVGPATVMPGDWQLSFRVRLRSGEHLRQLARGRRRSGRVCCHARPGRRRCLRARCPRSVPRARCPPYP